VAEVFKHCVAVLSTRPLERLGSEMLIMVKGILL
jgi:hypothetical protein